MKITEKEYKMKLRLLENYEARPKIGKQDIHIMARLSKQIAMHESRKLNVPKGAP